MLFDVLLHCCYIRMCACKCALDLCLLIDKLLGGECECNKCLMLHPDSRKCFTCVDYPYNITSDSCGTDVRQDQRRAFVLSLFLSSTGAANFYIESYGLGKYV